MDLAELLHELESPNLTQDQRAHLGCEAAKQLERGGDYAAASEAMTGFWQGVGAPPNLEGLSEHAKAEVLLRIGAITGWIGSASKIEGAQEAAKDLISESLRLFQTRGLRNKAGEARSDLALCYWRAGAYDEARVLLEEALRDIDQSDIEQRAIALLRRVEVERASGRLHDALGIFNEAAPLFDRVNDHYLIGTFHVGFATVLNQLSSAEGREDYVDVALMEYTAASFHFQQAGHQRYEACVENNLGFLFSTLGRFEDAHEHLDRAQMLMTRLKDNVHLAQADETRARVMLAEGRTIEAEKTARCAVTILAKGDELLLLAEALITHGIALAGLQHTDQARYAFQQAIETAEQAGDSESAGIAALTLFEQLSRSLSADEVLTTIERAGGLLETSREITTLRRLAKAAFDALFITQAGSATDWEGFSLKSAVHQYESRLIKLALETSDGSVTHAANLLGLKHHQNLASIIAARHPELISVRRPVRLRRKPLMQNSKKQTNQ
jgi:tetratricopeptide (TPR) repeat protein